MSGCLRYIELPLSNALNDVVGMTAEGFNYDLVKLFVAAYFQKIQKSQHNVFSAPKIPRSKLSFLRVSRKPTVFLLSCKHIANRSLNYTIYALILGIGKDHTRAAHHFSPIFAPPKTRIGIYLYPVLIHKLFPKLYLAKLISFDEFHRVGKDSAKSHAYASVK